MNEIAAAEVIAKAIRDGLHEIALAIRPPEKPRQKYEYRQGGTIVPIKVELDYWGS
jgi:hypothetical protein